MKTMRTTINQIYDRTLQLFGKNFKQDPDEIKEAMEFAVTHFQSIGKKEIVFAEIGVCTGGNFSFMGNVFSSFFKTQGIGIELPDQVKWGGAAVDVIEILKKTPPDFTYEMIIGDSQSAGTVDILKKKLDGKALDFLFIDGDHSLNGCRKDFDQYSPFVAKDGLTAIHDIIEYGPWPHVEVWAVWKYLKQLHKTVEFSHLNRYGIGYILPGQK